jgi:hypothetical protein
MEPPEPRIDGRAGQTSRANQSYRCCTVVPVPLGRACGAGVDALTLRKFYCEGYKAFTSRLEIAIRPITVVFGRNNSGKTSLVRFPVFAAASLSGTSRQMYALSHGRIRFGSSFRGIANADQPHPHMAFGLSWDPRRALGVELQYLASPGDVEESVQLSHAELDDSEVEFQLRLSFGEDTPPLDTWRAALNGESRRHLERNIEDLVKLLARTTHIASNRPAISATYEAREPNGWSSEEAPYLLAEDSRLRKSVDAWLQRELDRTSIDVDKAGFAFRLVTKDARRRTLVNLSDAGRGTQSVVPLTTILLAVAQELYDSELVIVEEPEAHLHPSAHGAVADLVIAAARRATILVETHSENFILRLRRRVAEGTLAPHDIGLYYLDLNQRLAHIHIDKQGMTDDWPAGVFEYDVDEAQAIVQAKLRSIDKKGTPS